MGTEEIKNLMSKYGKTSLKEYKYLRYKSNNKGISKNKKYVKEQLYILKKH